MPENHTRAPLVFISEVAPSTESLNGDVFDCDANRIPNFAESPSNLRINRKFQRKESILSSDVSLYVEKTQQKIPDGGWGWLVVVACFVINMISDGVSFTFGLLYVEFLNEFKASKSATSWIGSLFMALPLIAGPLGSALVDKYGCRSMTIAGGLVCTIGLILSSYARSIGIMYLTFGVIGGTGMCLCLVTAVVSIAFWFKEKRTIALGLAASGTGFGTAVFSPVATWLLYEYRWRGTLLITAGIFFNMCLCGVLMRDPDWIKEEEEKERKLKKKGSMSSLASEKIEELKTTLQEGGDAQYLLENVDTCMDLSEKSRFTSVINLPTFLKENETVPLESLKLLSENKSLYNVILENYPNLLVYKSNSDKDLERLPPGRVPPSRIPLKFSMKVKKTDEPKPPYAEDSNIDANKRNKVPLLRSISYRAKNQMPAIQPHRYFRNIRFRRNSMGYRGAMLNIHKYRLKASSCPDLFKNSIASFGSKEDETWYEEFIDILQDLTNFSLFLDLHFFLLSLSTIILFVWFVVPYFYLADHMTKSGYSESEASFAISLIGITNTVGMVLLGWAGDRINVAKTYAVCLILCGVSVGAILFFTFHYVLLLVSSGFFGIFFASCLTLTPSLLAELVPMDDFTMGYGLVLLCQGIGNLTGPPLAGLLYDMTESWNQSFYQAAFWIIISGVLIGIIPYTKNVKILRRSHH
nr:unnamed protein product [Callosobruchus chinensis]